MSRIVSATISYALSLKEVRQSCACTVFNPPLKLYWTAFLKKGKKKINGVKLQKAIYPWDFNQFWIWKDQKFGKKIYFWMRLTWKYITFVLGMAQFQPNFSPTGASATDSHPIKKKQNNNNQSNSTIISLGQRKRKLYHYAFWLVTSHVSRENPVKLEQWHVCAYAKKRQQLCAAYFHK